MGRRRNGFTLVEALLAVVIFALMAGVLASLYASGLQNLAARHDGVALDSALRSQMEVLLSEKYSQVSSGSSTISVNGTDFNMTWTVAAIDLDGDTNSETDAKQITVSVGNKSLVTLFVDHAGKLGTL